MNSDATVTACVFENNTGIYGGAITTQAPASAKTLTIDDCTFTANAAYTGGAVYVGPVLILLVNIFLIIFYQFYKFMSILHIYVNFIKLFEFY